MHKASSYANQRVKTAFIVSDSIFDLGFTLKTTAWGGTDEWVRSGAKEVGVMQLHKPLSNARVIREVMQPLLKEHAKYDKVSINVSSGATLLGLHEILMKAIDEEGYRPENYPSICMVFFNLNELMASIPNAPPGTPSHRTKDCTCWPEDLMEKYRKMFEDFSKIPNMMFIGPGSGEYWDIKDFDSGSQMIRDMIYNTGHPLLNPDTMYKSMERRDNWHFKSSKSNLDKIVQIISASLTMAELFKESRTPDMPELKDVEQTRAPMLSSQSARESSRQAHSAAAKSARESSQLEQTSSDSEEDRKDEDPPVASSSGAKTSMRLQWSKSTSRSRGI